MLGTSYFKCLFVFLALSFLSSVSSAENFSASKELFIKYHVDKENADSDFLALIDSYLSTPFGKKMMNQVFKKETLHYLKKGWKNRDEVDFNLDSHKNLFTIAQSDEAGASAQLGFVSIGRIGRCFPAGGQRISMLGILHHEMCHTKYGPSSPYPTDHWKTELLIVRKCENPMRVHLGYKPRATYYDPEKDLTIHIPTGKIIPNK